LFFGLPSTQQRRAQSCLRAKLQLLPHCRRDASLTQTAFITGKNNQHQNRHRFTGACSPVSVLFTFAPNFSPPLSLSLSTFVAAMTDCDRNAMSILLFCNTFITPEGSTMFK